MSSKTRMMGAGNAGSTKYRVNVNLNTFGGSKKQGITSRVGLDNWSNVAVQTYSNGYGRNKLFYMNQLGGVGAGQSMFNGRFTQVDGVNSDIDELIAHLQNLLRFYVNSDPYKLALVGDKETFKQDLINACEPELADEAHTKIIHFDDAYVFPSMPNRDEIISIVTYLNKIIKQQIPYMDRFGTHTLAMMPTNTGLILQDARYGLTEWHGLRIYYGSPGFYYTIVGTSATVAGANGIISNGIVPATYQGYPVVGVANSAFESNKNLIGLLDLSSITVIGNYAFRFCSYLNTLNLPNVTTIGLESFNGCTGLMWLNLPNVKFIGMFAFNGCSGLIGILNLPSDTIVGSYAFNGCTDLTVIQNGVTIYP
jgi:hypothetical protein